MPTRKLPPDEIVIADYRSGLSSGQMAEKYGVAPVTVLSHLDRIGEPKRSIKEWVALRESSGRGRPAKYWLGKKQSKEMIEKRISKIRGENHYLWKGGLERRLYRDKIKKVKCEACHSKLNLGIHHRDYNHYNDVPDNLQVLCVSCHMSLHKRAYWESIHAGKEPLKSNGPIGWEGGAE